jgi:Fur family ferric uptake transcriptional regulator
VIDSYLSDNDYHFQEIDLAPFEQFRRHLAEKKLKMTPQRSLVLDVFLDSSGHISAEELYHAVRSAEPSIGQATVYRTIKVLADAGIAREIHFGDGVSRYEARQGREHHDHLVCEKCRTKVEFLEPAIEALQEKQAREHGFTLTGHRMILFGLCPDCQSVET